MQRSTATNDPGWFRRAESLLETLNGVLSARVVARPGGPVEEVHLLTTDEIQPKQTVRNVESALQAQFGLSIDHRKISVAQTTRREIKVVPGEPAVRRERGFPEPARPPLRETEALRPQPAAPALPDEEGLEKRILFVGHSVESLRSQRLRMRVALEWLDRRYVGEAAGADVPRSRIEGFANATLRALEQILSSSVSPEEAESLALSLEGVKVVEAFDRDFVLVAVNALFDRKILVLTGAGSVQDSPERAVILATLQATDRRVRAFLEGVEKLPSRPGGPLTPPDAADPFEVWG
ncbi:MAG: hypothetical protein R3E98_13055 [Gemmatimonadota bacterium]